MLDIIIPMVSGIACLLGVLAVSGLLGERLGYFGPQLLIMGFTLLLGLFTYYFALKPQFYVDISQAEIKLDSYSLNKADDAFYHYDRQGKTQLIDFSELIARLTGSDQRKLCQLFEVEKLTVCVNKKGLW